MRLEEITQREIAKEKQRLESFKEKEKKASLLLKNKVNVLSDFIAERREIWTQKQENIHENKGIARQAGVSTIKFLNLSLNRISLLSNRLKTIKINWVIFKNLKVKEIKN